MELSAFVCLRCGHVSNAQNDGAPKTDFHSVLGLLDCEDKAEWIPGDTRSVLVGDTMRALFLAEIDVLCTPRRS